MPPLLTPPPSPPPPPCSVLRPMAPAWLRTRLLPGLAFCPGGGCSVMDKTFEPQPTA